MSDFGGDIVAEINPEEFGDVEGRDRPFDPDNACCNAPNPPGSFGSTLCCKKKTKYYVQKWTCVWTKTPLDCGSAKKDCRGHGKGNSKSPPKPIKVDCAWTKAWRCNFFEIQRCDVLKALCCRRPARCPTPGPCYTGECDCFIPADTYFAKVFEIEYEPCIPDEDLLLPSDNGYDACRPQNEHGEPGGCACCGLFEVCVPRWVKIHCKSQIPPELPYEVPLPYYERPERARRCGRGPPACAGSTCPVGPNANKSPDFWRSPVLPYA